MIGEKKIFTSIEKNVTTNDSITFGDNSQGKFLGHGKIAITTEHSISKVLLVESLNSNLLSVS
jgi:predicted HAD superfamily hydrolase